MKKFSLLLCSVMLLTQCRKGDNDFDASGAFEAVETLVSSQASGELMRYDVEEGDVFKAGDDVGYVDSLQLTLKKKQLRLQMLAVLSQRPNVATQLAALDAQLEAAKTEQARMQRLVADKAAPQKQLDDVNNQIDVINRQREAMHSSLSITSESITLQSNPFMAQIDQVNDQIAKCRLVNPVNGTVIANYAHAHELTAPGKPLYKIADLSSLTLRVYVTGDQLPAIKLNQQVHVFVDAPDGGYTEHPGTISWISDKAEFTPKTIQTKDERANLVYAIKVKVNNPDGLLKIGMYGEIKL
ncbi:MAG: efflux RND transporter periplasmic adaptor subunit [Flavobacteriales bacterium]|nr:efflux RND transporter periplasmic adaptor subunit [Flavobacteriales bacterium]